MSKVNHPFASLSNTPCGGIDPFILNTDTRRKRLVSFMSRSLYLRAKSPRLGYPLYRRLDGAQGRSRAGAEEKMLASVSGIQPRFLVIQTPA